MDTTSWRVIRNAASGDGTARGEFVTRYDRAARLYFASRWKGTVLGQEIEDAVQQVFVECFRHQGVLERAQPGRASGFRAYFHGVLRHIAQRFEADPARRRQAAATSSFVRQGPREGEDGLSRIFDRAWAVAMVREAGALMERRARQEDDAGQRRVKLLRMRFEEGLPIREIAELWGVEPRKLHWEYERARKEFKKALVDVLRIQLGGTAAELEQECYALLALLDTE